MDSKIRVQNTDNHVAKQKALYLGMTFVLIDELFNNHIQGRGLGCNACPACDECSYRGDPEMFGTECHAVIRTWSMGQARRL